ncbi:MAG: hypothetical protein JW927_04390 [Deltaproteobacteria bacterium]|nr:hypothetical protein [Deltaproteobacteria bacterium]
MGIFNIFNKDPSKSWPQWKRMPLTLDLRDFRLNQIKIGDKLETLMSFGKPNNKNPFRDNSFQYDALGCLIEIYDGVIGYFAIAIQKDEYTPFDTTVVKLIAPDAKALQVKKTTAKSEINELLGMPKKSDTDDSEIIDFYEIKHYELEVEYTLQKTVKRLNLFQIK